MIGSKNVQSLSRQALNTILAEELVYNKRVVNSRKTGSRRETGSLNEICDKENDVKFDKQRGRFDAMANKQRETGPNEKVKILGEQNYVKFEKLRERYDAMANKRRETIVGMVKSGLGPKESTPEEHRRRLASINGGQYRKGMTEWMEDFKEYYYANDVSLV